MGSFKDYINRNNTTTTTATTKTSSSSSFMEYHNKRQKERKEEEEKRKAEEQAKKKAQNNSFSGGGRSQENLTSSNQTSSFNGGGRTSSFSGSGRSQGSLTEDKRTWFQKGAFEDGYQTFDTAKSILGTASDMGQDLTKGVLGIGEGIIDTGAYIVGLNAKHAGKTLDKVADLFDTLNVPKNKFRELSDKAKQMPNNMQAFIERDLVEESKLANIGANTSVSGILLNTLNGETEKSTNLEAMKNVDSIEKNSVLGDKSDALVESAGQLVGTVGLQAVGVPWWVTTGTSSFGSGTEEAFQNDATYGEAGAYGLINAGADILTEKLSGGISFGGKTLDDTVLKPLTNKISNKTLKILADFGIDAVGEGNEEVIASVMQNIGKKLTYEDEKTWGEILASEEAMDEYLESYIGGMVLGGGANVGKVATLMQNKTVSDEIIQDNTTQNNQTLQNNIDTNIENTQRQINSELNEILNNKELPMQGYKYETSNNAKINNLRQQANQYFNNSQEAHKFVEMLEKIITDKDIEIRLDANLKTADGRIANGSYSNGVITINPNSTRTGEFIAIHELTHAIGTKSMMNIVENYRKNNAEFNSAVESLLQNYNATELTEEALSDVSAQLFGNQEFINNIANTNSGFFKKIYNEIKYLWHQFRGYKNQNQFVEDLYYKWTQAYNSNNKLNNTTNHLIETNSKGYKYVKADRQVIRGNNPLVWEQQVEDYINETIRKGKDVQVFTDDGYILSITEDTAGKAKFRNEVIDKNGNKRRLNNKEFMAKLRAETHIDELGETSIHKQGPVPDTKDHSFAKDGFTYRTAYFEDIDGQYYKITMSVGKNGDINTIYNIGKMQNAQKNRRPSINELKGSSGKTTSDRISSINSIPSSNENVNTTKYSMQESENNSGSFNLKQKQLDIINKSNPMLDDYHTGIRNIDDIKTLKEALEDPEWQEYDEFNPDLTRENIETAIKTGKITVYSSYPIKQGTFISPSYMEAKSYSGNGKVYSKEVNIEDVAWIDPTQGQYAKINSKYSQNNESWQQHLDKNFKPTGTRTNMKDIGINVAPTAKNNVAPSMGNVQYRQKKTMNPTEISNLKLDDAKTTPKLPQRKYKEGNKQSSFLSNIITDSKFLNEDLRQQMGKEDNIRYYQGITNEKTLENAYNKLQKDGQSEVIKWHSKDSKNANAEDVAEGWILLKQYQDSGDYQSAVEVAKKMRDIGTTAGQTVQAYNILSRLTPEGMFYYAQSELNEAYNKMVDGKSKKWIEENQSKFDLTPEETQNILDIMKDVSTMEDGYNKKVKLAEVQKIITNKIPPTAGQSIKAWMRISMLFNPKTQVRNVMGNAVILPVNMFSDSVSAGIDKLIAKKTGVRTTGNTNLKNYGKGFGKGLYESYNDFRKGINTRNIQGNRFEVSQGKNFNDKGIGNALNRVDNLLSFMLDAGDRGFYEATFTNSLNNQMVLNNATTPTQEMIDIATNEALQRTWQDNNKYTQSVLKIRNILNNVNVKGYGLGDVIIPFAKTPANLTKAIVDYSPAGLVKTLTMDARKFKNSLQNGQYSPQLQHQFVQNLGKATAGTFLYVLSYGLAKAGIATGEADEDKDVKNFMKNSLGISSYSIKIGDKTFSYDWAQPIATPLAIMTNYVKYSEENPDANIIEKGINAMNIGTEQLLQQSFMESLNTVLNGNGTTLENLSQAVLELPARAVPTFFKQIADMVDSTQRTTFEYDKPVQSAINSVVAKIPFASRTLPASVDTLGNEIQKYGGNNNIWNVMFNPANTNKGTLSKAGQEIYNVYKETGDTTIFPRTAPYYINSKGEKITMTSEQRSKFQTVTGKYVESSLSSLLNDKDYKKLSNEEKANIINEIVSDSYSKAKYDVLKIDSEEYKKLRTTLENVKPSTYYNYKLKTKDLKKDNEKISVLIDSSYTNKEKTALYETYILSSTDKQYPIIKEAFTDNGLNIQKYLEYKNQEFSADKEDDGTVDGKTTSGSKKTKVWNYIENMNISYTQKLLLYGLEYTPSDSQQKQILNYVKSLPNKTNKEKLEILSQFKGFTIYKDGTVGY